MKLIYHYSEKTGAYLGQGTADIDAGSGEAILPAHSTINPPPSVTESRYDTKTSSWVTPVEEVETPIVEEVETPIVEEVETPVVEELTVAVPEEVVTPSVDDLQTAVPAPPKKKRRRGRPR